MKKGNSLAVNIGGIRMKNPVMTASGTFGYGAEYSRLIDINKLGAIVTKTITIKPRQGNPVPRLVETPSGIINSIGLQNVGIEVFLREKLPFLRKLKTRVIVSIAGNRMEDYVKLAGILDGEKIDGIELNISCPNVKGGIKSAGRTGAGLFAQDAGISSELVSRVRRATVLPLIVKLSPNVTDISGIAAGVEAAGADAIALVNTFRAMVINVDNRRPVIAGGTGGLSGPAIRPLAVRLVWETVKAVKVPVIGIGGIMNTNDALEFIIAGAGAVSVGTGIFVDPQIPLKIIRGLKEYLSENRLTGIGEIKGALKI